MKKGKNVKKIIFISIIALALILLTVAITMLFSSSSKEYYGERCVDQSYALTSENKSKAKEIIEKIEQVKDVQVYTNICIIKVIVNLEEDVDIEQIKTMSNELLSAFSEEQLGYFDVSLFVTSENKESEVYPINVVKNKKQSNFYWR